MVESCIFCRIVAGESPCYKVYEDESFLGFLDINPTTEGHTLLIPKTHYRWVYDVPEFGAYWETALIIEKKIQRALKPPWVSFFTHGFVPHAHIHILPRYEPVDQAEILPTDVILIIKEEMRSIAQQIREAT